MEIISIHLQPLCDWYEEKKLTKFLNISYKIKQENITTQTKKLWPSQKAWDILETPDVNVIRQLFPAQWDLF